MVYNLYSDSIVGSNKVYYSNVKVTAPKLDIQTESLRPDRRAKEGKQICSEQVDTNTWIRTNNHQNETIPYSLFDNGYSRNKKKIKKYMGLTLNDIFAHAINEYKNKPCLGYRAVVTCPVFVLNEEGKHVLQEKSFRSSYTWYTYEQVGRRVQDIASGLYFNSIYPNTRAFFYASSSLEWFLASQACFQLAGQLVVAPEINEPTSLLTILKEAEVGVIFTSCDRLQKLTELLKLVETDSILMFQVKKIVLIDWLFSIDYSEPLFASLCETSSQEMMDKMISLGQIEEIGVENPINLSCTKFVEEIDNNSLQELVDMIKFNKKKSPKTQDNSNQSNYIERIRKISFLDNIKLNILKQEQNSQKAPSTVPLQRKNLFNINNSNQKEAINDNNNLEKKADLLRQRKPSIALTNVDTNRTNLLFYDGSNNENDCELTSNNTSNHYQSKNSSNKSSLADITKIKYLNDEPIKPNDLAMIVYSHGLLGEIKAVMLSHSNLAKSNDNLFSNRLVNGADKHCTTLPLDMVIEFVTEMCIFSQGGSIGYSSNTETLFYDGKDLFKRDLSDLQALNPTFLLVRPYILESLRSSIQNYLSLQYNPLKSFILTNLIYDYKKYWARKHYDTPIVNRMFCLELKKLFGSNLKFILCNGAADCTETKDFFTFIVNIPVIELYGPDEAIVSLISVNDIWDYERRRLHNNQTSSFTTNENYNDDDDYYFGSNRYSNNNNNNNDNDDDVDHNEEIDFPDMQLMPPTVDKNVFKKNSSKNLLITSSILCPTIGIRIRLEDWEDFRTNDLPYPRGRMIIGGDIVSKGYYNKEISTRESFYTDSNFIDWFRTDDIARVFPNGSFEIISGLSDIIKMDDGQFISLSQIEHILRNSQFVDNVCAICGDNKKFIIALVVPNLRRLALKSPGQSNLKMAIGMEPEPEELLDIEFRREVCNDRLLCEFLTKHLNDLILKAGFKAIPSRVLVVPEIWAPVTELVTPSFEPKRNAIQNFYATDIQSIVRMEFGRYSKKRVSSRLNNNSKRFDSSNWGDKLKTYSSSNGARLSY